MKAIEVVKTFGHAEGGPVIPDKQFLALKAGDKIVIQLHGEHDHKGAHLRLITLFVSRILALNQYLKFPLPLGMSMGLEPVHRP